MTDTVAAVVAFGFVYYAAPRISVWVRRSIAAPGANVWWLAFGVVLEGASDLITLPETAAANAVDAQRRNSGRNHSKRVTTAHPGEQKPVQDGNVIGGNQ